MTQVNLGEFQNVGAPGESRLSGSLPPGEDTAVAEFVVPDEGLNKNLGGVGAAGSPPFNSRCWVSESADPNNLPVGGFRNVFTFGNTANSYWMTTGALRFGQKGYVLVKGRRYFVHVDPMTEAGAAFHISIR